MPEPASPPSQPTSGLWVVRHGETEWSAARRHTGVTDVELTAGGEREARELAGRLAGVGFARVLTSPRVRARRTAELAGFADAEVLEDLREWEYGQDEGRTTEEIREERPGWTVWTHGPSGGESAQEVQRRADRVIELVRSTEGPVLAFCHGHFSRVLGARWIGLPAAAGAHLLLSTAALGRMGWERETPALVAWNETGCATG